MPINVDHSVNPGYRAIMEYLMALGQQYQNNPYMQYPWWRPPVPQPNQVHPQPRFSSNRQAAVVPTTPTNSPAMTDRQRMANMIRAGVNPSSDPNQREMATRNTMAALNDAQLEYNGATVNAAGRREALKSQAVREGLGTVSQGQVAPTVPGAPPSLLDQYQGNLADALPYLMAMAGNLRGYGSDRATPAAAGTTTTTAPAAGNRRRLHQQTLHNAVKSAKEKRLQKKAYDLLPQYREVPLPNSIPDANSYNAALNQLAALLL